MVQIPDLIIFLYDSYRKFFRIEFASNTNDETGIGVSTQAYEATFQEDNTHQLSSNTGLEVGTLAVSIDMESRNIRLGAEKSVNQRSRKIKGPKPSRLPIHIRHHKV